MSDGAEAKTGGSIWAAIALGAIAATFAAFLYVGTLDRPLDAPDFDFVSDAPGAAKLLPLDRILLEPIPADLPDLGLYRPAHGALLRIEAELWPGNVRAYRGVSLALLGAFVFFHAMFVCRLIEGTAGRIVAVALLAVHPAIAGSVIWVSEQSVLLSAAAWTAALWVFVLARDRAIAVPFAGVLIGGLYLVAFGAREQAALLPIALLALGWLLPAAEVAGPTAENGAAHAVPAAEEPGGAARHKKRKKKRGAGEEAVSKPPATKTSASARAIATPPSLLSYAVFVGIPLALVAATLVAGRLYALDGRFGPDTSATDLAGTSIRTRLATGLVAFVTACSRFLAPVAASPLYPARYESALMPIPLVAMCIAVYAATFGLVLRTKPPQGRILAAGMAVACVPLLPFLQFVPVLHAFAERSLLLALPGAALALSAFGSLWFATTSRMRRTRRIILAAIILSCFLFGHLIWTLQSIRSAKDPVEYWKYQANRHPKAPQPLVFELMNLVARPDPKEGFDVDRARELFAKAVSLAKPPDADLAYHYMALLHTARRDPDDFGEAFDAAIASPGPHSRGFFSTLGVAALQQGMLDRAERAINLELADAPDDFNALFALARLHHARGQWTQAVGAAGRSLSGAPSHMRGQVFLQIARGLAAREGKTPEDLQKAIEGFQRAIDHDPLLTDAYFDLARLYVENGYYAQAENVLALARDRLNLTTHVEIYRVQVDSLERQNRRAAAIDLLNEATRLHHPFDLPLKLFAARHLLDAGAFGDANRLYMELGQKLPRHPDVLYGLGRVAWERDRDARKAAMFLRGAVQIAPGMKEARELLENIEPLPVAAPAR